MTVTPPDPSDETPPPVPYASPAPPTATPAQIAPPVAWQSPAQAEGPAPGLAFAPHGQRLVAYILDTIILTVICGALIIVASALLYSGSTVVDDTVTNIEPGATTGFVVLILVAFLIGVFYFPFFWARGGQTPGMRPFDLRVVSDRDGGRIGWGTAFLRLVGLWVAGAVFYLGYIWIFIDKRRRGWQDLIANTLVVKQV